MIVILVIRKEDNMKINFIWDKERAIDEIEIIANPFNKEKLVTLRDGLSSNTTLNVQNPKNNRKLTIDIQQIEVIQSLGHLSKLVLVNNEEYLLQKRLKELQALEANGLYRINNSTILNLSQVTSFRSGDYARLEVFTKSNNNYLVSRHYAKLIKERLA
jgi:DNA-binding LytR/AlgR family response regulator